MLLDFNWGGKEGEVSYPGIELNSNLTEGQKRTDLKITKGDDIWILSKTLMNLQMEWDSVIVVLIRNSGWNRETSENNGSSWLSVRPFKVFSMALLKARETLYRVRAFASISQKSTGLLFLMTFCRVVTFFIHTVYICLEFWQKRHDWSAGQILSS